MYLPTSHPWTEGETLGEQLESRGVSRRDFLTYCGDLCVVLGVGRLAAPTMAHALQATTRPTVIWLQLQECTGCVESVLRTSEPTIGDLVLDLVSLDYQHTLMAAPATRWKPRSSSRWKPMPGSTCCWSPARSRSTKAASIPRSAGGRLRRSSRRLPPVRRRSSPSAPARTGATSRRPGQTRPARSGYRRSSPTSRSSTSPAVRRSPTW